MSAPTSGSSGSSSSASPVPGYYPDPSIPNYIRYWNGSAWVPGTSRPAPASGETLSAPPGVSVPAQAPAPAPAPPPAPVRERQPAVDESGPMFLDEDPRAPLADYGPRQAQPAPNPAPSPAPAPAPAPAPTWPRPAASGPGADLPRISWGAPGTVPAQAGPQQPQARPQQQAAPQPAPVPQPAPQPQPAAQAPAPWAQQVHELAAGDDREVLPWRPPAADPFAAMSPSQERPGGLTRRFAARVVDTVLFAAVTGAAAVPLGTSAYHHVQDKVDEAKLTGETVRVWLIDGTTGAELGAVLAVAVLAGLLLEVLPTARWGRTLGKKLVGLKVLDIESQVPPGFGASLRRWLTHTVLDALVVGVAGLVWCLFDRPWRQCWHDKAARTFVAGV
jgi:uncharacterized RDD family membrane protein YckC